MKKGIHPVQKVCKVKCACGNEFEVKSTKDEIRKSAKEPLSIIIYKGAKAKSI